MPILEAKQKEQVKKLFQDLKQEVRMVLFTSEHDCEQCLLTLEMLSELAELSPKLSLEKKDIDKDKEEAKKYGVDKTPAIVLLGEKDYGIRFFGVPAGYEFTPLVEDIINLGKNDPRLPPEVLEELKKLDKPVHIQVMTVPT